MRAMRGICVKGNACIHPTVGPFFWEFNGIPIHLVYVHSKTLQYSLLALVHIAEKKRFDQPAPYDNSLHFPPA